MVQTRLQKAKSRSVEISVLSQLAERCETALTGSRELDALIECELRRQQAYAVGLNDDQRSHWMLTGTKGEIIDHQRTIRYHPPIYTLSLDAALSLVPEKAGWDLQGNTNVFYSVVAGHYSKRCETPPLALCAAVLRAREAQLSNHPSTDFVGSLSTSSLNKSDSP